MKRRILLTPNAVTTSAGVKQALIVEDTSPDEQVFLNLQDGIKADLVSMVHGEKEYRTVLIPTNSILALEFAIISVLSRDDQLLVINNGGDAARIVGISENHNIPTVNHQLDHGSYPDLKAIEQLIKEDGKITHLAMVHHETTTGMLNPVKEMCLLAQQYGIEVIVDVIGSIAGVPIDIQEWGAACLIGDANHCIQNVSGISFAIVKESILAKPKKNLHNPGLHVWDLIPGVNEELEIVPPVHAIYGLRKAIDEYMKESEVGRRMRYTENWETLVFGLQDLGFRFTLPYEHQSKIVLTVLEPKHPSFQYRDMYDYLYEQGFIISAHGEKVRGTFQLSIQGDLYHEDIVNFLASINGYLKYREIN